MNTLSLRKRLFIAAALILVTFLGLAGFALDRAFISSAEVSLKNQLRTQTFALLSVLEVNAEGEIVLPAQLPEARLLVPNSGLYAVIVDHKNNTSWQSPSSIGIDLNDLEKEIQGSESFYRDGSSLDSPFRYSFSISWETEDNNEYEFTLVLIEASQHFAAFVDEHRGKIILWLGMVGAFLLSMQMLALNWSLSPLSKVANELDLIETAKQDRIQGRYPQEIEQLSQRINQFIGTERKNMTRYRNTLGDLAHSLKTPLAVLRGISDSGKQVDSAELGQYVGRMSDIVEYQLQRAAASRVSLIGIKVNLATIQSRVRDSLNKVYADKHIRCDSNNLEDIQFYGDESDLYEILGNVMDNAYKWANKQVRVQGYKLPVSEEHPGGIRLVIEDDGPGINAEMKSRVLQRGVRADQRTEGQGIGLAVCLEIVERYDGTLDIGDSDLGGAKLEITLRSAVSN